MKCPRHHRTCIKWAHYGNGQIIWRCPVGHFFVLEPVKNPGRIHHTAKWRRMVKAIRRRGGAYSPYAVATARLGPSRLNPSHDTKQFFKYVWSFYGPRKLYGQFFAHRLTKKDLLKAINKRIRYKNYEGDSVDREAVRDILLAMPKYKALKNPHARMTPRRVKIARIAVKIAYRLYRKFKGEGVPQFIIDKIPAEIRPYVLFTLEASGVKVVKKNPSKFDRYVAGLYRIYVAGKPDSKIIAFTKKGAIAAFKGTSWGKYATPHRITAKRIK